MVVTSMKLSLRQHPWMRRNLGRVALLASFFTSISLIFREDGLHRQMWPVLALMVMQLAPHPIRRPVLAACFLVGIGLIVFRIVAGQFDLIEFLLIGAYLLFRTILELRTLKFERNFRALSAKVSRLQVPS